MISVHFQGKPSNITVIQVYAPTSNAEEAEVEWFYEDLQDLLELTPKKDILFIIGDWNAKVVSQETPRVTGKFGLEIRNEAGQRHRVLPRERIGHRLCAGPASFNLVSVHLMMSFSCSFNLVSGGLLCYEEC